MMDSADRRPRSHAVANDVNQIVTIPRRGLDPRRPLGAPSAADKQEMLVPYEPYMPQDPKRVVSHRNEVSIRPLLRRSDCLLTWPSRQVLGISAVHSSPALLESTSIVLALGLDLFQTRVMPSGGFDVLPDSFNKLQLVLTIMGLTAGIVVTRVRPARWYLVFRQAVVLTVLPSDLGSPSSRSASCGQSGTRRAPSRLFKNEPLFGSQ
jgi:hypothetical protein